MAIQHRMDGAFGRNGDTGEAAAEALADFTSAPAGVLALHVEDVILHLKGKLVGITKGAPTPVGQTFHSATLVATEDLVAGLARDAELSAEFRHPLAPEPTSHKL